MSLRRLALVTDAWRPQTNGVVNTLVRLVKHLEAQGTEVLVVSPGRAPHDAAARPYPEIRVACDPWKAIQRIRAFEPDAIHVATEGPLGFWTIGWLRRQAAALHDQLSHALRRVPERALARSARMGLQARALVPRAARSTRWSARCRCCASWTGKRVGQQPGALAARRRRRASSTPAHRRDEVYRVAAADLALRRARGGREEPGGLPGAAAAGHQGGGGRRSFARGTAAPLPRRRLARLALRRRPVRALRQRRLLRVSVAHRDLRQRAARGDGVGPAGGVGAGARSRRHRSRKASTARSTTTCCAACMRAAALLARATRARASRTARCMRGHEVFRAHLVPVQPQTAVPGPAAQRRRHLERRRPAALPRPAQSFRSPRPDAADQGTRSSGWPIWMTAPSATPSASAKPAGANTMMVDPSSNQPISSPLRNGASQAITFGPAVLEMQQHVEEVQPDAGDQDRRHRHQRDRVTRCRRAGSAGSRARSCRTASRRA